MTDKGLTPDAAADRLEEMHGAATAALREALERCLAGGLPPDATERARFRYPALRVTHAPRSAERRVTRRAWAKFQAPGVYQTTVTQPAFFRRYLLEQLRPLSEEFGALIEVLPGTQEIPFPYVLDRADAFDNNSNAAALFAAHFPTPSLTEIGDEVADGLWEARPGTPLPLALFDGARVDYSLRRLVHYTGTDWRAVQPWILLTNYHRYVDQFLRWGLAELAKPDTPWTRLVLPGGVEIGRDGLAEAESRIAATQWHRFQMPAYHLLRGDGDGVTLVNIGVGPSNAKNITDHLAVLRPNCWLMVGHCAGLRQSQTIGDYVLAHGYLRRDRILDDLVPPEVPVPALAEVQVALQEAAARVTGDRGEALKRRLRTGTVVTYEDRNWELRWSRERRAINLSRAIAADMESGTLAAQGYRFRVPYGTLLCVSDRPLHGEIKLPGTASAFYERAVQQHLMIGLATLEILRGDLGALHSRKLRSFDEPPFPMTRFIANARMYAVAPAAEAAWQALLAAVARDAEVPLDYEPYAAPAPLEALWQRRDLGCVFMCGFPIALRLAEVRVLAAPIPATAWAAGRAAYRSDFIVRAESPFRTLADTFGHRIGWTVAHSQSGFNAPRHHLLALGGARYRESVGGLVTARRVLDAVLEGRIEVGPLDAYWHALIAHHRPDLTRGIRVVESTALTPIPALVAAPALPEDDFARLRDALIASATRPWFAALAAPLQLAGFAAMDARDYGVMLEWDRAAREAAYDAPG